MADKIKNCDLPVKHAKEATLSTVSVKGCSVRGYVSHLCIHSKNPGRSPCCSKEEGTWELQLLGYGVHVIFLREGG